LGWVVPWCWRRRGGYSVCRTRRGRPCCRRST